mmetsp:Transcript_115787/g.327507  ORF Transcript_115787/g.327507 Transcript_115787/m.327507 type:complete len:284 (-) Transcript_115787:977-1828(-)
MLHEHVFRTADGLGHDGVHPGRRRWLRRLPAVLRLLHAVRSLGECGAADCERCDRHDAPRWGLRRHLARAWPPGPTSVSVLEAAARLVRRPDVLRHLFRRALATADHLGGGAAFPIRHCHCEAHRAASLVASRGAGGGTRPLAVFALGFRRILCALPRRLLPAGRSELDCRRLGRPTGADDMALDAAASTLLRRAGYDHGPAPRVLDAGRRDHGVGGARSHGQGERLGARPCWCMGRRSPGLGAVGGNRSDARRGPHVLFLDILPPVRAASSQCPGGLVAGRF